MQRNPRQIESLICRSLDGALSEEEQLELNRELIRNRESQAMFDAYRSGDALAASAIDASIPDREHDMNPEMWIAGVDQRVAPRSRRGWWLVPGAIAAALLAVVLNQLLLPVETDLSKRHVIGLDQLDSGYATPQQVDPISKTFPVSLEPKRRIHRDIARDIYDILGDEGQIYRIEVDRAQILKKNTDRARLQRSSLEL